MSFHKCCRRHLLSPLSWAQGALYGRLVRSVYFYSLHVHSVLKHPQSASMLRHVSLNVLLTPMPIRLYGCRAWSVVYLAFLLSDLTDIVAAAEPHSGNATMHSHTLSLTLSSALSPPSLRDRRNPDVLAIVPGFVGIRGSMVVNPPVIYDARYPPSAPKNQPPLARDDTRRTNKKT